MARLDPKGELHNRLIRAKREWREKSERERDHSRIFSDHDPYKMQESQGCSSDSTVGAFWVLFCFDDIERETSAVVY